MLSSSQGKKNLKRSDTTQPQNDEKKETHFTPKTIATPHANIVTEVKVKEPSSTVHLSIPSSLKRRFQIACNADGQKMSSLLQIWISEYLKQREKHEA